MNKTNIILADCKPEEIRSFADGCNEVSEIPFEIISKISNWSYESRIRNLKRFLLYFSFPFKIFLKRKRYNVILGWQQFYAINLAFFCHLFHVRKRNTIVAVNFTYKRKCGVIGKIYRSYMKFSCNNKYLDFFHVPSFNYVKLCCADLGLCEKKFIVTGFGVPDTYDQMKNLRVQLSNYTLSIGRSNRDFDFLVDVWKQDCLRDRTLVIASDTWKPQTDLPENIIFRNDIKYDESFSWFNCCDICITPIADGTICSGDTVLLTGMMFAKPVVVTTPSTLAEMYVRDGENGVCVTKNAADAASRLAALLNDRAEIKRLGLAARKDYLTRFSRESMGRSLLSNIKDRR